MAVQIRRISATAAEIAWSPEDDLEGLIATAVDSGRLKGALSALGEDGSTRRPTEELSETTESAAWMKDHLERRVRAAVVTLRDERKQTWSTIEHVLYGDVAIDKRSSARGVYKAGLRQINRDSESNNTR